MNTRTMKKLLGTMLFLLVPLAACGDDETGTTTNGGEGDVSDILALQGNVMDGEQVYEESCAQATCHGADGNTGASSSPALSEAVPSRSDQELAVVIRFGTINDGGVMPETNLPAQDIADVIAFLRQQFPAN